MTALESILGMLPDRISGGKQDQIFTPPRIAKEMIEILPDNVWNSHSTFLDPACKSGIFLYEIYEKLMETPSVINDFPDKTERRNHILNNQLYGIALNDMALMLTERAVYGQIFMGTRNVRCIKNYMLLVKDKDTKNYKKAIEKEFGEKMAFDIIIGNPPYQESTGDGARAKPIYSMFFEKVVELKPRIISFITPLRWFSADDRLSILMRKFILSHNCIKIANYSRSEDIFENTSISGGVGYFVIDSKYNGSTSIIENGIESKYEFANDKIFVATEIGRNIVKKVGKTQTLDEVAKLDCNFFGLDTNEYGYAQKLDVLIRSSKGVGYMYLGDISKNKEAIEKYKVITGAMRNSGPIVINAPEILNPGVACTRTYNVLEIFDTLEEAQNFASYIKTKVARFLISITLNGQMVTRKNYQLVPNQDFSHPWTDEMLYKKYNLTQEEIDYIEKTIKPME